MVKIAVVLGAFSVGARPIDFTNLYDDPRGLTGTDLCFARTCEELERLGHTVIRICGASSLPQIDETYDCVLSINEPNLLIGLPKKPYKIVWQMLNDFSFIKPGFDDFVDQYFGVCPEHTAYVARQCPKPEKWSTLSLGCDPDLYSDKRVPGRVLWCSSADRGLHWLLQEWKTIRAAVPNASLRVAYHFSYDNIIDVEKDSVSPQGGPYHPHIQEMAQRVRYIREMMPRLPGVQHIGSISRNRMVQEFSEASVFGFCADTVAFSEGFSVSTLEAHASFTVPVVVGADCLSSIYRESGCVFIEPPARDHIAAYTESVIEALQGKHDDRIPRCRAFAEERTWKKTIEKLEHILRRKINEV